MSFSRKAAAKVLLFFELTKYFGRKMHFCLHFGYFCREKSAWAIFGVGIFAIDFSRFNMNADMCMRSKTLLEFEFKLHRMGMCFIKGSSTRHSKVHLDSIMITYAARAKMMEFADILILFNDSSYLILHGFIETFLQKFVKSLLNNFDGSNDVLWRREHPVSPNRSEWQGEC